MEKELNFIESQKHGKIHLSKIIEKESFQHKGFVYDIKVANSHSYSVDDIIVHNSAGASLILFLLGITRVDPIEWNFPFERFINDRKTALDSEKIRITIDDKTIDFSPNEKVILKNGEIKLAKDLKEGDDISNI